MSVDQDAIRDELAGWPISSGYYQMKVGVDEATEMAESLAADGGPIAAILARAEQAEAAVERVRELHSVRSCGDSSCEHCRCRGCGEPWPCPTSRALGGAS